MVCVLAFDYKSLLGASTSTNLENIFDFLRINKWTPLQKYTLEYYNMVFFKFIDVFA